MARKGYRYYFKDGSSKPFNLQTGSFNFTEEDYIKIDWNDKIYDPYEQLPYETKNAAMSFEINGYENIYIYFFSIYLFFSIILITINNYLLFIINI